MSNGYRNKIHIASDVEVPLSTLSAYPQSSFHRHRNRDCHAMPVFAQPHSPLGTGDLNDPVNFPSDCQ